MSILGLTGQRSRPWTNIIPNHISQLHRFLTSCILLSSNTQSNLRLYNKIESLFAVTDSNYAYIRLRSRDQFSPFQDVFQVLHLEKPPLYIPYKPWFFSLFSKKHKLIFCFAYQPVDFGRNRSTSLNSLTVVCRSCPLHSF